MRALLILMAIAISFVLIACGDEDTESSSGGDGASAASEVRIVAKDNQFDPAMVTVPAGQPVKVTFVNEGKNVHEVEIKGLVKETSLQPGQSKSFTITPKQQSYKLYCEIHEDNGMEGEFIGQ